MEKPKIKTIILEKLKNQNHIWISALYKTILRDNIDISWPAFISIISELEEENKIIVEKLGNMKFIRCLNGEH